MTVFENDDNWHVPKGDDRVSYRTNSRPMNVSVGIDDEEDNTLANVVLSVELDSVWEVEKIVHTQEICMN